MSAPSSGRDADLAFLIGRLEGALEHATYNGTCLVPPDLIQKVIAALREGDAA